MYVEWNEWNECMCVWVVHSFQLICNYLLIHSFKHTHTHTNKSNKCLCFFLSWSIFQQRFCSNCCQNVFVEWKNWFTYLCCCFLCGYIHTHTYTHTHIHTHTCICINEWVNEWLSEWRMNERTNECVNERTNERMNEWVNEWMSEWTNKQTKQINKHTKTKKHTHTP